MIVAIYVEYAPGEYDRLDMFDDEKITLKFKVKDSADIGKMFSTYSQTFTVPASDKNNRLLDYFFDTTVVRSSTKYINAKLYVNDTLFKLGKIGLNEAAMKHNSQTNYNINFFTGLSTLKDLVGDDLLSEVFGNNKCIRAWTPNSLSYQLSGGNSGFPPAAGSYPVRSFVPLASKKRVWTYGDGGPNDIKYNGANTTKLISLDEVRPAVGLLDVLLIVFQHYNINIDISDFSDDELINTYIHCNGPNFRPLPFTYRFNAPGGLQNINSPQGPYTPWNTQINAANNEIFEIFYIEDPNVQHLNAEFYITIFTNITAPNAESNVLKYKIIDKRPATYGNVLKDGIATFYSNSGGFFYLQYDVDPYALGMNTNSQLPLMFSVEIDPNFFFTYTTSAAIFNAYFDTAGYPQDFYQDGISQNTSVNLTNFNLTDYLLGIPKIKVIDFLSSLFKMFNARVLEPLNGTSTISFWIDGSSFYSGEVDYSDYVNSETHTIKPPDIYKTLSFSHKQGKYKSSVDYALVNTNNPNSKEYGQLLYSNTSQYDKNTYDIKTAFTIVPNVKILGSNITTWYSFTSDDGTANPTYGTVYKANTEDFTIFCYNGQGSVINANGSFGSIGIKDVIGLVSPVIGVYNLTSLATSYTQAPFHNSLGFKDEVSVANNNFIYTNNLYSKYYAADISRLYNPNTKIFTFEGYLPADKILSFNLRNLIIIGNQKYTIEEADIDITTGKCKLVLMNYAPVNVSPSIFGLAPIPPITIQTEIL